MHKRYFECVSWMYFIIFKFKRDAFRFIYYVHSINIVLNYYSIDIMCYPVKKKSETRLELKKIYQVYFTMSSTRRHAAVDA